MRGYWVYILASKPYGTLYIGVTNGLLRRTEMHRNAEGSQFTAQYGVGRLVYFEEFAFVKDAIQREKSLKRYLRQWKINLIEQQNPHWSDLYPELAAMRRPVTGVTASRDMGPRDKPEDDRR